jgi:hypothetical protein
MSSGMTGVSTPMEVPVSSMHDATDHTRGSTAVPSCTSFLWKSLRVTRPSCGLPVPGSPWDVDESVVLDCPLQKRSSQTESTALRWHHLVTSAGASPPPV